MGKNKSKHHENPSPGVKLGKVILENLLVDREKAEESASTEIDKGEQASLKKVHAELEGKSRESAEWHDKLLRLGAEFENYKKRMQKETSDLMKFGNESLLKAVLPILDNLERAIAHGKKINGNGSLLEGVEITLRQLLNILERFGVKPVVAMGEAFDPEKHEAVSQTESDQEPDRVIAELEKGYLLHERLLRPAKVLVSKALPEKGTETK